MMMSKERANASTDCCGCNVPCDLSQLALKQSHSSMRKKRIERREEEGKVGALSTFFPHSHLSCGAVSFWLFCTYTDNNVIDISQIIDH